MKKGDAKRSLGNELWTKHRSALFFALGMFCFLAAGLLVYSVPSYRNRLPEGENIVVRNNVSFEADKKATSEASPQEPLQSEISETPIRTVVRRSAGATSGISVQTSPIEISLSADMGVGQWYLYITGSVRRPGVYRLPAGARLFQLVELAGGLNNFADPVAVNMALPLEDGMHVHVPREGENRPDPDLVLRPIVDVTIGSSDRIDINQADERELTALQGVGTTLARRILEDRRRNGRFATVDDLLRVKGIGPKILERFRDSVVTGP